MAHVILHNPLNTVPDAVGDGMDEGGIRPSEYNNPHSVIIDAGEISHSGLANLGVGNPHPQYLLESAFAGVVLLSAGAEQDIVDGITIGTYLRVGSNATPSNTTAGDLTATRFFLGAEGAVSNNSHMITTVASHVPAVSTTYYQHLDVTIAPNGSSASERDPFNISYKVRPTANDAGLHIAYRIHMQHDQGAFDLTHSSNALLGTTVVIDQNVALSTVTFMTGFRANMRVLAGTSTTVYGFHASSTGGGTIGTYVGLQVDGMTTPGTQTNVFGVRVNSLGGGTTTTVVGVEIAAQTGGTNSFGIRNAGNSVQTGYAHFGAVTAPSNVSSGDVTLLRLRALGASATDGGFSTDDIVRITGNMTTTSGVRAAVVIAPTVTSASNSTAQHWVMLGELISAPSAGVTLTTLIGIGYTITHRQDSTLVDTYGAVFHPVNLDASSGAIGTITTGVGFRVRPYTRFSGSGTVTVTNLYGTQVLMPTHAGLTSTNLFGVYITNASGSTITNLVGIEIDDLTGGSSVNAGIRNRAQLRQVGNSIFGVNAAPSALVHIQQQTVGNEVLRLESVATNDDPRESTFQNRAATTDATVTTLHTVTIPASTTVMLLAFVSARRTGGASGTAEDGAGYVLAATIKNVAGTATIVGVVAQLTSQEDQAAWDATIDVTGATARVRVTGAAGNNITWHVTLRYMPVGS